MYRKISDYHRTLYPNTRGCSERSIRRFCRAYNRRISDVEIDSYVENFIPLYGHRYGRSMMQGSIRYTLGISSWSVSQRRIARSLKRLAPLAYEARAPIQYLTGPIQYLTLLHTSVIKDIRIKMKKLLWDMVARMWLW